MISLPFSGPRRMRLLHRIHARAAVRSKPAGGFKSHPEPRTIGRVARGRQILAGNIQFGGMLVEAPGTALWDIDPPGAAFEDEAHGFTWLDDLYAVGDSDAQKLAMNWTMGWIDTFGQGKGPGWVPQLTARRVIRLINHALFLLRGQDSDTSKAFYRSLGQQTLFLVRSWKATPGGLPRIEALTGVIHAGISLIGMEEYMNPAINALCAEARILVANEGAVPSRNPEELMDVLTLLNWATLALREGERPVPALLTEAITAIVPILRALRHADGGLARFHGGGKGMDGWLDQALDTAGVKTRPELSGTYMGYVRMSASRTSLIIDAAAPPDGPEAETAHASTLAFELTSGRRPLIVSCGSGRAFGPDWRKAGRATPSHSTLGIDGWSSSRFGPNERAGAPDRLRERPGDIYAALSAFEGGTRMEMSHDGYRSRFGLTHGRTLDLSTDGRMLEGDDFLAALSEADIALFDAAMDANALQGIPFTVRFHLHPEAEAELDLNGKAVSIGLKSGEIWVFRHDSPYELALKPSFYLETGRLRPRPAQQVVLSGRAMSYATRVRWSLAKAHGTPVAVRDYATDEDL